MVNMRDIHPGTKLLVVSKRVHGMNAYGDMDKWLGQIVTCAEIEDENTILLEEDRGDCPFRTHSYVDKRWFWSPHMFECIVDNPESEFEAPNINEMQFLLYG